MVNNRPHGFFMPTGAQLRAARAVIGLSASGVATETGLGVNTIRRAEDGGAAVLTVANAERLVATYRALGITFLEANADGPGIRFHLT